MFCQLYSSVEFKDVVCTDPSLETLQGECRALEHPLGGLPSWLLGQRRLGLIILLYEVDIHPNHRYVGNTQWRSMIAYFLVTKVTDGVFPVQAYVCEPMVTAAFADSFSESPVAWPLAPIVATLRFWGLSVLVLAVAVLAQQASGTFAAKTRGTAAAAAADPPGFGALAAHFESKEAADDGASLKFFSMVSRVLLENCIQLWLQSSFFAITFDRLNETAKNKVSPMT